MKKLAKILAYLFLTAIIALSIFMLYIWLTDYKPESKKIIQNNNNESIIEDTSSITLLLWNIGYCGLNKEMDFFYDGGTHVYPEKNVVDNNINGIIKSLKNLQSVDIMMLQEVDICSKRSYFTNQEDSISKYFPKYNTSFAYNYLVPFVPLPISKPMGKVSSGLLTLSKFIPKSSERYSFEGNYNWPKYLFMLDRCFLVNRYSLKNGKQLLVINTHNSAYDDGGLRKRQLNQLKEFIENEYQKGNYVIVGGDWNQCPPNFKPNFESDIMDYKDKLDISSTLMPENWKWIYDNSQPSNRRVDANYVKNKTLTTVIDFFLLSPNIEALDIKNIIMNFEYSDHQAVKARIRLKK